MKKFVKFTFQDYMDIESYEEVQVMAPDDAMKHINHMNAMWSGGYYDKQYHVMTNDEALAYAKKRINQEKEVKMPDSEEFIERIVSALKECYDIDYKI